MVFEPGATICSPGRLLDGYLACDSVTPVLCPFHGAKGVKDVGLDSKGTVSHRHS